MIIDIHAHCFPHGLALKAVPKLAKNAGIPAYTNGTVEGLTQSMAEAGICKSVLQPIATKPPQVGTINQWAGNICEDSIESFATVHPDSNDWEGDLNYIIAKGFKGVKLHPDYQGFFIDEDRMFPIYECMFSAGLIVLFHAGVDIGLNPPYHCNPERLLRVHNNFPNGKIIASHMGSYMFWDEVCNLLEGKNIYYDTSYSFHMLGPEKMGEMIKNHGADRVLFGTDSPWASQKKEIENILTIPLSDREKDLIFWENACEILALEEAGC